ncbi:ABC transporter permease [Fangia hongkongensis]|uniref:ABC transporter permease n=1 Tax=Fangia hongkongensis TaxID=270495 RepID=UPI0003707B4B|nr:ABC transporter permease subunit [Fangia hongkongensis]MBK2124894.1 ABC transporter permease subunit [Fangia hongkongensis]
MRLFPFSKIMLILGLIFLYIPLVVLILFSFSNSEIINLWGGFTLDWYKELFQDSDIINAALVSLQVAVVASLAATILGTIIAYSITRFKRFRGKHFLYGMTITPLVLPDIVLGVSLLLMFTSLQGIIGWPHGRGMMTIILAHITFCTAYVTIVMQARIRSVDLSIEEAAMDLGAKPLKVFFQITLPQIIPSLIASFLLAFTLSIDDLVITEFVAGSSDPTLPMYIYSTVKNGPTPEINALATIMIAIISTVVVIGAFITFKVENNKKKKNR